MIVCPSSDDRIEQAYQVSRCGALLISNDSSNLVQVRLNVFPGRLDNQLSLVLADILAEEMEPFRDMRHASLVRGQFQPSGGQKLLNQRFDSAFEKLAREARYNQVSSIANQSDLEPRHPLPIDRRHQQVFQATEGYICQRRRNDTTLRCPRF